MRIVVLIKQTPDTEEDRRLDTATGRLERDGVPAVLDQICETAIEVALLAKESVGNAEVTALTLGPPPAKDALRTCLAMGADRAVHVCDPIAAGADAIQTARILAAALRRIEADLVIAGEESTDGRSGVVPAAVAELLGIAFMPALDAVAVAPESVSGRCRLGGGDAELAAATPAVVSVTERAAEARFPTLRGIMSAKRKPLETLSLAELGPVGEGAASVVDSVRVRPVRAAGEIVAADDDGARRLVDFLVARRLI